MGFFLDGCTMMMIREDAFLSFLSIVFIFALLSHVRRSGMSLYQFFPIVFLFEIFPRIIFREGFSLLCTYFKFEYPKLHASLYHPRTSALQR